MDVKSELFFLDTILLAMFPLFTSSPKESWMRTFLGVLAALFVLGVIINLGSGPSQPSSVANASSVSETSSTPKSGTSSSPSAKINWNYSSNKNDVTEKTTEYACTESVDRSAEFCFRRKSEKLESYISFANGRSQFWCPENCYVLIKADSNQPMRLSSTEAETNSQYIFVHPASKLLAVVNRSETLNIEVPIFEEGRDVLHFKVEGISWK